MSSDRWSSQQLKKYESLIVRYYNSGGNLSEFDSFLSKNPTLINKKINSEGHTLLFQPRNRDFVNLLIQHGADVHIKDSDGNTALMYVLMTSRYGHTSAIEALIEHSKDVINVQNKSGNTALIYAINTLYSPTVLEIVKLLIKSGADVALKNKLGNTALEVAYEKRDYYKNLYTFPGSTYTHDIASWERVVEIIEKEMMKHIHKEIKKQNIHSLTALKVLTSAQKATKGTPSQSLNTDLIKRIMRQSHTLMPPRQVLTSAKSAPTYPEQRKNKSVNKKHPSV